MEHKKAPLREKMAYALTDSASNLVWATVGAWLMFFYTDVFGITAAAVGTLFLVARIWDAINDPIMGIVIDNTKSKFGKSRPWFLWMAVPFGIATALTFYTPDISMNGKLIYAYVTYISLGMIYTAINIPVTSILPSLSKDPQERTVFGTFRIIGAFITSMVISIAFRPITVAIGGGTLESQTTEQMQKGFFITMVIFGIIGALMFIVAFFNIKERVIVEKPEGQKITDGFKAIKNNKPWLLILLVGFVSQISNTVRGSSSMYFLKYNLGRPDLVPILGAVMLLGIFSLALVPLVAGKIGKRNTMIIGISIGLLGQIIVLLFGINSITMLFVGNIIGGLGMGFGTLGFVLISDTVDYGEYQSGVRAEGLLSAASSFGQKLGTGVGGAIGAWLLAFGGYIEGNVDVQPQSALNMILVDYAIIPIICSVIVIILLYLYKVDKDMPRIIKELEDRRNKPVNI